jgi:sugar fermentation stimulation protein A
MDPVRKTPYTVEAVSLNRPEDKAKSWIGINQNAINRYVEHYLVNGGFHDMIAVNGAVQREQFLGKSKLDFLAGDTYIEVKTPLQVLQVDIPDYVEIKKTSPFDSTDRFVKHITDLTNSLQNNQRAILLTCFLYDNPGFRVIERSTNYRQVKSAVDRASAAGLESWQANFLLTAERVTLAKYFRLSL